MGIGVLGVSFFVAALSYSLYRRPQEAWLSLYSYTPARKRQLKETPDSTHSTQPRTRDGHLDRETILPTANEAEPSTQGSTPNSYPKARSCSPERTPKARRRDSGNANAVPTISLDSSPTAEGNQVQGSQAASHEQLASGAGLQRKPPTLKPLPCQQPEMLMNLMPPPPRPSATGSLRARPMTTNSLRVPSSGPLPNRGPLSTTLLAPSASLAVKTPNPRQKVQLKPGYSPLDWATLLKSGGGLSGVSTFQRVTPSLLKHNNGRKGRQAWSVWRGRVYNITPYLPYHPGGEGELMRAAGKDGEKLFMEAHPWVNWENMLGECLVGVLVGENEREGGGLDEMD